MNETSNASPCKANCTKCDGSGRIGTPGDGVHLTDIAGMMGYTECTVCTPPHSDAKTVEAPKCDVRAINGGMWLICLTHARSNADGIANCPQRKVY